jgi:hypothetical protein
MFEPTGRVEDAHHVKLVDKYCCFSCLGSLTGSPKMPPMKQVLSKLQKYLHSAPIAKQLLTRAPNSVRAGLVIDTDISAAIYKESTGIIADVCVTRA